MTDYTISCKLSNETVYACYRGRFWRWDGSIWKESHIMTKKFERAKAADKKLTPQAFLTNGAEFAPLDEYEIDCAMLDALENAKPCKNAPIEPVEELHSPSAQCSDAATAVESQTAASPAAPEGSSLTTETADAVQNAAVPASAGKKNAASSAGSGSSSDKYLTFIPESMAPKFDYSGLSDQTVADLHLAEKEYRNGKKMAARGYIRMGEAVEIAHDALVANCDKHNNQHSEDNFRKWCLSIGITKDTAYRLLQISSMFESSSPRQQDILQELPPSLLYAAAKPSAPSELVEKVKNGEVTTNKAYQDLLKENQQLRTDRVEAMNQADRERARADRAEAERDKARADQLSTAKDCNRLGLKASQEKDRADKAEARAKDAENQLSGSRQVAEAAKLRADKLQAENAALKKQPIAAVVDEEEVERRANQRAHDIAEDLAAEMTADLQARLEQVSSGSEQDARDAYDSIILAGRSITSIVQSAKMQFRKLPDDQRETAINQFVHTLASAQGEVSACL